MTTKATLFGVPGSHPTFAARADAASARASSTGASTWSPGSHRAVLRALGFPGITVPAMRLDGSAYRARATIALALDALRPEPPLFPRDPDAPARP